MDTSSSSYYGYSPPMTPLLKRRKPEEIARDSMRESIQDTKGMEGEYVAIVFQWYVAIVFQWYVAIVLR